MEIMPCVHVYASYLEEFATLTDSQFGALVRGLLKLNAGQEPTFAGTLRHIWPSFKGQYLRDAQAYREKCEINRLNAMKRGRKAKGAEPSLGEGAQELASEAIASDGKRTQAMAANNKDKEKEKDKDKEKENKKENNILLSGEASKQAMAGGETLAASPDEKTFSPPSVSQVEGFCQSQGLSVDARYFVEYYTARGWYLGNAPMRDWKAAVKAWAHTQRRNYGKTGHGNDAFTKARQDLGPLGITL